MILWAYQVTTKTHSSRGYPPSAVRQTAQQVHRQSCILLIVSSHRNCSQELTSSYASTVFSTCSLVSSITLEMD